MKVSVSRKAKWVRCAVLALLLCFCLAGCGADSRQIRTLGELNNKRVAVALGAVHATFVKECEDMTDAEIVYSLNNSNGLAMLMANKVDAFATDYVMAQSMIRQYNGLLVLDEPLNSADYGFAFRKEDPRAEQFSAAIAQLKADGVIASLMEEWMGSEKKSIATQTWPGENGTLTCMVSADEEPLCYKDVSGTLVGFDIDLLLHIAEKLDYRIQFVENNFEDLLPSVMAGQVDLAASGITITAAREEQVAFAEPYLEASSVVIVRDTDVSTSGSGVWLSVKNSFHRVFVEENRWQDMLRGICLTIWISLLSAAIGLLLGAGMYLWDYSGSKVAKKLLGALSTVLGYLPLSTFLLMIYYIIFSGNSVSSFWVAIITFSVTFAFSVYGSCLSAVGAIPKGQAEAAASMGYNKYQALRKIYLPQALPAFFGSMQGAAVGHIRGTSLVEFIGLQDIQTVADNISARTYETIMPIALTAVVYICLTVLASHLVGRLGKRICPPEKEEEEIKRSLTKGDAK